VWRTRHRPANAETTLAPAVLGPSDLALRLAALYPWLDVPVPAVTPAAFVSQGAATPLLTSASAVIGGRDLAAR
jgi:hypothetical protein